MTSAVLLQLGCRPPTGVDAAGDDLEALVRRVVAGGCKTTVGLGADVPEAPATPASVPGFDLVLYTAHPDDEAMYAGGTLMLLSRARRQVALVVLSHGEGGRLLERREDARSGKTGVVERRDRPRAVVAAIRDRELARAAALAGVELAHLYPAAGELDFAFTQSCPETLRQWERQLPGGVADIVARLIADIRVRRPRVILTMDRRDDPTGTRHGHHTALGLLVDLAARLAARPGLAGGRPHTVGELWTFAPRGLATREQEQVVAVEVNPADRLTLLRAHASQFTPESLDGPGSRPREHFALQWRARGAEAKADGTLFQALLPGARRNRGEVAIEVFPVFLREGRLHGLYPRGKDSWQVITDLALHPHQVVKRALDPLALRPMVVHSTSWRHAPRRLILTYLAVVEPPAAAPAGFADRVIDGGEIARAEDATRPPQRIGIDAVINHALEHLGWLYQRDPAVRKALGPPWRAPLSGFAPQPFKALGTK